VRPRLTALLVLGLLAFACLPRGVLSQHVQQTERTKVGAYELGETYNEIVSPDPQKKMDTVCPQTEAPYELGATLGICRPFADFRAGKDGEFKVPKGKLEPGIQDVTVKFQAGKVCEVSVVCKQDETSFEIQRLMVTRRYGEPTKTDRVKFQNGIGAAWHCKKATWALNTGDTVMVAEGIVSSHHHVFVDFVSKDKPQEPELKNPY
jgi:hypothetical protein